MARIAACELLLTSLGDSTYADSMPQAAMSRFAIESQRGFFLAQERKQLERPPWELCLGLSPDCSGRSGDAELAQLQYPGCTPGSTPFLLIIQEEIFKPCFKF